MMTRDKVIEILEKHLKCMQSYNKHCLWDIAHSCVACENFTTDEEWMQAEAYAIESLQERKTGKWVQDEYGTDHCSCCDYIPAYDTAIDDIYYSPYCPNCGAKMEVSK